MSLPVTPVPGLLLRAFTTRFPDRQGQLPQSDAVLAYLDPDAPSPVRGDDAGRRAIRDMLRTHGYRPAGRGKPSSEYLARAAAAEGGLRSINLAVDCCNAVSLHSGIPISVIDLERVVPPIAVRIAEVGARYAFNPSGQEIEVAGLPCLCDAQGPCANAVKDAQRTKTDADTRETLSLLWGAESLTAEVVAAQSWYCELLERIGARIEEVALVSP